MSPANFKTRIYQTEQEGVTIYYLPDIVFEDPNPEPPKPEEKEG